MVRFRRMAVFSFLPILSLWAGVNNNDENLAEFLAGFTILQANWSVIPEKDNQRYYIELERVTGLDGKEAAARLKTYRNLPEKWSKLQEKIRQLIETDSTMQTEQASDDAGLPAVHSRKKE